MKNIINWIYHFNFTSMSYDYSSSTGIGFLIDDAPLPYEVIEYDWDGVHHLNMVIYG